MKNNKIILLTGPGGSGKSTVAELLYKRYNYVLIDGDHLDTEFFPNGGQWSPNNKDKLIKAHDKIIDKTKIEFDSGKDVVVDYIIFGEYSSFLEKIKEKFGSSLVIKVLFPDEDINIQRDKNRACWTTGPDRIKDVRNEFLRLKNDIGKGNFIDTSNQNPKETALAILNTLE